MPTASAAASLWIQQHKRSHLPLPCPRAFLRLEEDEEPRAEEQTEQQQGTSEATADSSFCFLS